ncbi:phytoene desaturase family protein [Cryobacterium sp. GrIS_2_6]|uniref:phytoene desaturase family protein n=1 Tax=Cryobacterium sp. GrIS_2_6 TaxID=3162785 RepID=UPI002DFC5619|nr:phytoene desaturase family protein [Cryobacterium psychrotolerans]MEC5150047.1 phytoene desaturase [Cryobacterium psychrotolerans]
MTPSNGNRTIVIGGGIAGLASAALLARDGHLVTLLETNDTLGGRAGSWTEQGFRFETGPSWYLMPGVFDHFFRLFGTSSAEQLELRRLDPGYRVFFEDDPDPIDIRAERADNVALFESLEPGAGAALDRYLDSAEDTYRMAVSRFLYTSFQSFRPLLVRDVLTRLPRLARLLLQPLDKFVAGYVRDPRLRQVLGYPAVFLGSSPDQTPSMYHLMSHLDLADGVLYPQGGFTRLIDSIAELARAEGVEVITGARVTGITTTPGTRAGVSKRLRASVTGVSYVDRAGTTVRLAADRVVSAADLHHTETELLPEPLQSYPESWWQRRVSGPGAVLVLLGVSGQLPKLQHHTLLFTRDWGENFGRIFGKTPSIASPASFYVCMPSATDPGVAPDGSSNLFLLVPIPADPGLGHGGIDGAGSPAIEAIADDAIGQLADWAGIPDLADRIVVRRTIGPGDFADDLNSWRGGALGPAHTLKQSAFFRGSNASAKIDGLYYAGGTTIPGIGLPMCLISAEILLKRMRSDTSTGPLPEPMPRRTPVSAAVRVSVPLRPEPGAAGGTGAAAAEAAATGVRTADGPDAPGTP